MIDNQRIYGFESCKDYPNSSSFCCSSYWHKTLVLLVFSLLFISESHAKDIFEKEELHKIEIFTDEVSWFDSLQQYYNAALHGAKHKFVHTQVIIDGDTLSNVGLRFKGKYSNYGFPGSKKPFRLDFNQYDKNQTFQGLKKLNLHNHAGDPSFLREFISYDLFGYLGVPASRCSFTKLYINGEYWGCYLVVEEPNKPFLEKHFGNKTGNFFECIQNTALTYKGDSDTLYKELELQTDSHPQAWDNTIQWIKLFNTYYGIDFPQHLNTTFDLEGYFKVLAVDVLINNPDAYFSNGRNFYLYDDVEAGLIRWIPWDYNLTYWKNSVDVFPMYSDKNFYQPLIYRIKQNEQIKNLYLSTFCSLLENELKDYPFDAISKKMQLLIQEAVETDSKKFYTYGQFLANRTETVTVSMLRNFQPKDIELPGVATLYTNRLTEVKRNILSKGFDCGNAESIVNNFDCVLYPIPAAQQLNIYSSGFQISELQEVEINIYTLIGEKIYSFTEHFNYGKISVDVSLLNQGVYLASIKQNDKEITKKFFKE